MMNEDSPILDFYPLDFEIDQNGKSQSWMGIALLPFIDENRLQDAMKAVAKQLTEEEIRRNTWGSSSLTVGNQHPMYDFLCSLYAKGKKPQVSIDFRSRFFD
jgi:5'-3' exoribonuclease 2